MRKIFLINLDSNKNNVIAITIDHINHLKNIISLTLIHLIILILLLYG